MRYLWAISLVAALGGLLFGYDWVVIGGAKPFYETALHLTGAFETGWAMSSALAGCLVGSMISGVLSDRYGRKLLLIGAGFFFTVSAIGTALAHDLFSFAVWRLVGGLGIGIASNLSPVFIAEISPAAIRGKLVSMNQLTIVIGILAAQLTNWLIAEPVAAGAGVAEILASWNGRVGWRWMFGAETVPALFFFFAMFAVPESPRWLVKSGQEGKAAEVLVRIGGGAFAGKALKDIRATLTADIGGVNFGNLLERRLTKILALGVALAVFQQWCGINVIFNYAADIFAAAGYGVSAILFNIVITGTVNLLFTLVAIRLVDRVGRKALLLFGAGGLFVIYLLIGASYRFHLAGVPLLILVVTAIACYACTLAPVTWVVLSEIFPNRIRGAAMSISVSALWIACFILTYTFPLLNQGLGPARTFWTYAGICVLGFLFIWKWLPETRGKSLEDIERELVD
jgi:SP family sugar porter-like MFS transporter